MSSSIPGPRDLPISRYDLTTYWGRVQHSADLCDPRTLFSSASALERSTRLLAAYKHHELPTMTPELWSAKKLADSTLHPDTGKPVFLPFRMSCFVLSNLVVTAGMLQPNLTTRGVLAWQVANQTLNVCINSANANKSNPQSPWQLAGSFFLAVGASCGVALGLGKVVAGLKIAEVDAQGKKLTKGLKPVTKTALGRLVPFAAVVSAGIVNVGLMRGGEIIDGIEVYDPESKEGLGRSNKAAVLAVGETAVSRVVNATPIMVIPPMLLMAAQRRGLKKRWEIPVNVGLIAVTSVFALPLALGVFPQRQSIKGERLEKKFWDRGKVEFNRGI